MINMDWLKQTHRNPVDPPRPGLTEWVIKFRVGDETFYDKQAAVSPEEAIELWWDNLVADQAEGDKAGWAWFHLGEGRVLKARLAFIAGIVAQPPGGQGRWSDANG